MTMDKMFFQYTDDNFASSTAYKQNKSVPRLTVYTNKKKHYFHDTYGPKVIRKMADNHAE